jgi:hypothetical protein
VELAINVVNQENERIDGWIASCWVAYAYVADACRCSWCWCRCIWIDVVGTWHIAREKRASFRPRAWGLGFEARFNLYCNSPAWLQARRARGWRRVELSTKGFLSALARMHDARTWQFNSCIVVEVDPAGHQHHNVGESLFWRCRGLAASSPPTSVWHVDRYPHVFVL